MAIVVKNIRTHLECAICLDRYQNPKQLSCPHVFCKSCIDRALEFRNDGSAVISCPQCRKRTYIGYSETSNNLASNLILNSILGDAVSENPMKEEKVICYGANKCENEVTCFCLECKNFLCKSCERRAHSYHSKATIAVSNDNSLNIICDQHQTVCEYMCCDKIPVCVYCIHRRHADHECNTLENQVELIKATLKAEIRSMEQISNLSSILKQNTSSCEKQFETALQSRKIACLSEYIKLLNQEELEMKLEFKKILEDHNKQFDTSVEPLKEILKSTNIEICLLQDKILSSLWNTHTPQDFERHTVRLTDIDVTDEHPLGEIRVDSEYMELYELENLVTTSSCGLPVVSTFDCDVPEAEGVSAETLFMQLNDVVDKLATIFIEKADNREDTTNNERNNVTESLFEDIIDVVDSNIFPAEDETVLDEEVEEEDEEGEEDNAEDELDENNNEMTTNIDIETSNVDDEPDDVEEGEIENGELVLEDFEGENYSCCLSYVEDLIRNGEEERLNVLLRTRLDSLITIGFTPLRYAVMHDKLQLAKQFVDMGCSVEGLYTYGQTLLHCAVLNSTDCLRWLCSIQPNLINVADDYGDTPLHYAAFNNKLNGVKVLCKCSDINIRNNIRKTALEVAKERGNDACAKEIERVHKLALFRMARKYGTLDVKSQQSQGSSHNQT